MPFKIQIVTLIPALASIFVAIYLSIIVLTTTDPVMKKLLLSVAVGVFFGGVAVAFCWMLYWAGYGRNPFQTTREQK